MKEPNGRHEPAWARSPSGRSERIHAAGEPKAEQLARIDERQKFEDALDAGFDLSKTRLTLLKSLGHMEDWLNELRVSKP